MNGSKRACRKIDTEFDQNMPQTEEDRGCQCNKSNGGNRYFQVNHDQRDRAFSGKYQTDTIFVLSSIEPRLLRACGGKLFFFFREMNCMATAWLALYQNQTSMFRSSSKFVLYSEI
jgi:hypothetical protein